jgi:hypothetical protein
MTRDEEIMKLEPWEICFAFLEFYLLFQITGVKYRAFQKEIYSFESLYEFIQRTCTVIFTVIM